MPKLLRRVAVWTAVIAAGCSPGKTPLTDASGRVTHNGKPLDYGAVVLESPPTGFSAFGVIQPGGAYHIDKVPPGEYRVAVTAPELPPPGSGIKPIPVSDEHRKLFDKYTISATSGLTATVGPDGGTVLNFDLK